MTDVRKRVGVGNRRARLVRQAKRAVRPSLVGAVGALVGMACFVYLLMNVDRGALVSSHQVAFQLRDASGVKPQVDEVRFHGIPAGKITKLEMGDLHPVITVDLESKYGPIYRNATAVLRPNTALQDMYLNITDRGTPTAGRASTGSPVPLTETDSSVRITDVLDVFQGNERARMAQLLDNLGNGLQDRGAQLRAVFAELVPFVQQAARITDQLGANAPLTKHLVHDVAILTAELGAREVVLRRLVEQGSLTLSTAQDGSADLNATLAQLPSTLTSADRSFTAVRGVVGDLNGALRSLLPVARQLPASLKAVRDLTGVARPAVQALGTPVKRLLPLSRTLRPVSANLSQAIGRLLPQVDIVNTTTDVVTRCLPELNGFMQWDASMSKFGDSFGAAPRGNAVVGGSALGVPDGSLEYFPKICAPGTPIGGRPAQEADEH